ncbi:MAG: hypothetical protein ACO2ZM_05525 [Francisellaceae bacterium]
MKKPILLFCTMLLSSTATAQVISSTIIDGKLSPTDLQPILYPDYKRLLSIQPDAKYLFVQNINGIGSDGIIYIDEANEDLTKKLDSLLRKAETQNDDNTVGSYPKYCPGILTANGFLYGDAEFNPETQSLNPIKAQWTETERYYEEFTVFGARVYDITTFESHTTNCSINMTQHKMHSSTHKDWIFRDGKTAKYLTLNGACYQNIKRRYADDPSDLNVQLYVANDESRAEIYDTDDGPDYDYYYSFSGQGFCEPGEIQDMNLVQFFEMLAYETQKFFVETIPGAAEWFADQYGVAVETCKEHMDADFYGAFAAGCFYALDGIETATDWVYTDVIVPTVEEVPDFVAEDIPEYANIVVDYFQDDFVGDLTEFGRTIDFLNLEDLVNNPESWFDDVEDAFSIDVDNVIDDAGDFLDDAKDATEDIIDDTGDEICDFFGC